MKYFLLKCILTITTLFRPRNVETGICVDGILLKSHVFTKNQKTRKKRDKKFFKIQNVKYKRRENLVHGLTFFPPSRMI